MSTTEYLAIAAGLIVVWQSVETVLHYLEIREQRLLWSFALPL